MYINNYYHDRVYGHKHHYHNVPDKDGNVSFMDHPLTGCCVCNSYPCSASGYWVPDAWRCAKCGRMISGAKEPHHDSDLCSDGGTCDICFFVLSKLQQLLNKVLSRRKKAILHDQQARFTFSNPNPKTKPPLNAKD